MARGLEYCNSLAILRRKDRDHQGYDQLQHGLPGKRRDLKDWRRQCVWHFCHVRTITEAYDTKSTYDDSDN